MLAQNKAKDASIMDAFHKFPDDLGNLTVRQIDEYLLHPRRDIKEGGGIKMPEPTAQVDETPMTPEEHVLLFRRTSRAMGIPPEDIEKGSARIRAHYAAREGEKGAG